jgi:hypothetical protein
MPVADTPSQKAGRALIVVSGILLAAVVSQISQRVGILGTPGSEEWWQSVAVAIFDPRGAGPIVWILAALFALGNALNLWGLWPELRSFRFSIGHLMAAVGFAALVCFFLRFWPAAGFILILLAALLPVEVIEHARRRDPFRS